MSMRKKIWEAAAVFGLAMAVAGCGAGGRQPVTQEEAGTQNAEALREQVLAEMSDEQKNWMGGLSKEQRLADFESLCDGLRENYPYVKLAKRQTGADPVYLILPNSGLVVQYSPMYGVTADGTGSEACGTVPDMVSPEGESALETCLKAIAQGK